MPFFVALGRRNVFNVAITYAVVGWFLLEIASTVLLTCDAPQWILQTTTLVIILGFSLAAILAWALEFVNRVAAIGESS